MEAQHDAYKALVSGPAPKKAPGSRSAVEAFAPIFFNNLTLVQDAYFVHRTRAHEGKHKAESSVSKLQIGDEIRLDETRFRRLFEAYFAELRRKFMAR